MIVKSLYRGLGLSLQQIFIGASYPLRAVFFIQRHRLWRWTLIPILLNVLLMVVVYALASQSMFPWFMLMAKHFSDLAGDSHAAQLFLQSACLLVGLVVLPLLLMDIILIFLFLGQIFFRPFLDILSERVEGIVQRKKNRQWHWHSFKKVLSVMLQDACWGLLYLLPFHVPILLLLFPALLLNIPVLVLAVPKVFWLLAPFMGAGIGFYFGSWMLAHEFVGLPMARHCVSYPRRFHFLKKHRFFALGFGFAIYALLLMPGLHVLMLPLATVGGSMLFYDLKRQSHEEMALLPVILVKGRFILDDLQPLPAAVAAAKQLSKPLLEELVIAKKIMPSTSPVVMVRAVSAMDISRDDN